MRINVGQWTIPESKLNVGGAERSRIKLFMVRQVQTWCRVLFPLDAFKGHTQHRIFDARFQREDLIHRKCLHVFFPVSFPRAILIIQKREE